jgi:DNA (cytosine-5)-methyltransferase 1
VTGPRLLDLFCGAGGAGTGYHQAGFEVVGVDIRPQPRYPFEFIQADCLALDPAFVASFGAVHASPPCQAHCDLKHMHNAKVHVDLVPGTRAMLRKSGLPYVIENVEGAPLINPSVLCGTMFGLGSDDAELWRHRLFETSFAPLLPPPCQHRRKPRVIGVYGGHGRDRRRTVNTQDYSTEQRREAMGINWMTGAELSQAIPPAYTKFIGEHLLSLLRLQEAA